MLTLFAQGAGHYPEPYWLGPTIASTGFFIAVMVSMLVALAWRNGRLAHEERMKAMEIGFPLPPKASRWPTAIYCAAVGLGVPTGTFFLTWMGSQSFRSPQDIWVAPSIVSVVALIGTSIVAAIGFGRSDRSMQPEKSSTPVGKPAVDPESLDFSGRLRRG
jgi:hypothetical protein